MYYSIHNDRTHFAALGFDWKQIVALLGDAMDTRFDVNQTPRPYSELWKDEITVTFSNAGGLTGSAIPDIAEHQGRLFLPALLLLLASFPRTQMLTEALVTSIPDSRHQSQPDSYHSVC